MNPKYPIYIPSYKRYQKSRRKTIRTLERNNIPYHVIVEPEEESNYRDVINTALGQVLVLPREYKEKYTTYIDSDAPLGSGPARNFGLEHALSNGHDWYWCIDDNIKDFYRHHKNHRYPIRDGSGFAAVEDLARQYSNVAMAGMRYSMFHPARQKNPPIAFNRRIYSCNLIQTDIGYRWQGRYNEDVDLSLRMLKDGWSTVRTNVFLADKEETQTSDGGNTDTVYDDKSKYDKHGTHEKSKALKRQHPTVVDVTRKYGRWHHEVDYSPFADNDPQRKDDPPEPRDYNMKLKQY
jgi:hypothetical protein